MDYKKCEHCGEEIHIRSKKCPFCNQTVAEVPEETIKEEGTLAEESKTEETKEEVLQEYKEVENKKEDDFSENFDENIEKTFSTNFNNTQPSINLEVGANGEPKDYVYKAEVRHSLAYTKPLSNLAKVFISALCTIPVIGQLIGIFLGVFFSTYDDTDKRSFGKALIYLSIFMFLLYSLYIKYAMELLGNMDVNSLLGK